MRFATIPMIVLFWWEGRWRNICTRFANILAGSPNVHGGVAGGGTDECALLLYQFNDDSVIRVGWQVVDQTHALVLASGTLSPLPLLQRQLFPHHPLPSLQTFICNHVVPSSRLLLLPFPCGPTGLSLDLRHSTRSQPAMMDELGRLLMNICQAVPEVGPCRFP